MAAIQLVTTVHPAALFGVKLVAIGLLTTGPTNAQSPPNNSLSELGRLIRLTSDADQRGDLKTAIASAEACAALRESMEIADRSRAAYDYCENYLGKALLQGKGLRVMRDEALLS